MVRTVGRGVAALDGGQHSPTGREGFGGFVIIFYKGNVIALPTVKCFRLVCENFTTFPFGKRIVGDIFSFKINLGLYEELEKKPNDCSTKLSVYSTRLLP